MGRGGEVSSNRASRHHRLLDDRIRRGASPFEQLIGRDWLDGLAESDRLVPDDALLRRER
jgi:hypothetical protein